MPTLLRLIFALVVLAPVSAIAAGTMGPLESYVLQGAEDTWEGTLSEDAYRLESKGTEAGQTRYFFVEPTRDENRFWTVAVKVKLEPGAGDEDLSFAGIICAVTSQPRTYLAFGFDSKGRLSLLRRNDEGMRLLWTDKENPSDPTTFNELRVVESEGRYEVLVNGERIRGFNVNISIDGGIGIIANGRGGFLFRDFTLKPSE
jgi:hypothetical protein